MSDTVLFGRTVIKGTAWACILYVLADSSIEIGSELQTMKPEQWAAMSAGQITGWVLSKIGGVCILVKAFYSNSSAKKI